MKVQDFAYRVSMRTIEMLEETQHYKIPEATRKEVAERIQEELDQLIQSSNQNHQ